MVKSRADADAAAAVGSTNSMLACLLACYVRYEITQSDEGILRIL